jgi:hypothetical protein
MQQRRISLVRGPCSLQGVNADRQEPATAAFEWTKGTSRFLADLEEQQKWKFSSNLCHHAP